MDAHPGSVPESPMNRREWMNAIGMLGAESVVPNLGGLPAWDAEPGRCT